MGRRKGCATIGGTIELCWQRVAHAWARKCIQCGQDRVHCDAPPRKRPLGQWLLTRGTTTYLQSEFS